VRRTIVCIFAVILGTWSGLSSSGAQAPAAPTNLRIGTGGIGVPASVSAIFGTPQSATINTAFATALTATVRDASSNPLSGVTVTFSAPGAGASASFSGAATATAVTNASGAAAGPTLTANGQTGSYTVTASAAGVTTPASFSLTNTAGSEGGVGVWTNVTPAGVDLTDALDCSNFGTITSVSDPARPSNLYTEFFCQGVWKSTDYGQTWTGPINTGSGGSNAGDVAGGLAIAPGANGQPPILYSVGIRGRGTGFWKSTDGGISWTNYNVAPGGSRQDFYPPVVDPYNGNHLLMAGHEMNLIVQSVNGGQTWTAVPMAAGMDENGGTGYIYIVNTGNAGTTANTWLWSAQGTGGAIGTWRTTNGGTSWVQVDTNEHPHGEAQYYQPDSSGVVYMAGIYSKLGWGVLRSVDYGQTWSHVGSTNSAAVVFGTPNKVYAMYAWACGPCTIAPTLEIAPQPGTTGWASAITPSSMAMGAAQAAVVFDGTHYIIVTANWLSGIWRFVE
jgi:hypothetical protein